MQFALLPQPTSQKFCLIVTASVTAEPKTQPFNFLVKEERPNTHTHTKTASEHFPRHFSGAQSPCYQQTSIISVLLQISMTRQTKYTILSLSKPNPFHYQHQCSPHLPQTN